MNHNEQMSTQELKATIREMVVVGKGILAADESAKTAAKRLASINVESTEETRRQYRNLILNAPEMEKYISGVILFEETLRQKSNDGVEFPKLLAKKGILPGIKVDEGLADFNGSKEQYTKGLDSLSARLEEYKKFGTRFAKWRAVYSIRAIEDGTFFDETFSQKVSRTQLTEQLLVIRKMLE